MISSRANAECKRKCMNHDINALLPFLQNSSAMLCTKASVDLKINSSYQPTRQIPIKAETLSNSHSLPNTPFKDNEKRPFLGMHQFSNQFNSPKQIREALDQKKKKLQPWTITAGHERLSHHQELKSGRKLVRQLLVWEGEEGVATRRRLEIDPVHRRR